MKPADSWVTSLRELHAATGLSYREIAARCDLDHSYVGLILDGKRRPTRDVLTLLLAFGYGADRIGTDAVLMQAGYPPLGRSTRDEFRRHYSAHPNAGHVVR
ncbi:MAG: helix-turn-helix transcriptional regulator [Anaerolineales bacterium]|nr:helix-turn-helix transcriptional regulator [Anaerolineales bacterium]